MELQVIERVVPSIQFNKVEIEQRLREELAKYEGLVVTKESEKDLKATRANLNKLKKQIDEFRKDTKNEVSKPIKVFENEVKSLTQLIDESIKPLDAGLKEIDQQRRDKKLEWVREEIKKIAFEFGLDVEHAAQIDIKATWLTKACSETKVITDIKNVAEGLKMAQKQKEENKALIVESCQRLGESPVPWLDMLKHNDITYIMRKMNEKREAPNVEVLKAGESNAITNIEPHNQMAQQVNVTKEHIEPMQLCPEATAGELLTYTLELTGTRMQLHTIRQVIERTGVKYRKI